MKIKKLVITTLLLVLLVPFVYSQPREIKIEGHDQLRYTVETIKAKPGETLKITLKTVSAVDKSQMAHNWVLLKQGTDAMNFVTKGLQHQDNEFIDPELKGQIIAKTDMLGDGEVDSVTFTVPEKKGEYQYVCTFRAHFQAGMKGTLIVEQLHDPARKEVITITRDKLEQTGDQQDEVVDYAVKVKRIAKRLKMSKLLKENEALKYLQLMDGYLKNIE